MVEINKNQYTCHSGYVGLPALRPSSTHSRPHSFLERRRARPARECRMWEFPAQGASNVENVSIWWRHHGNVHIGPTFHNLELQITLTHWRRVTHICVSRLTIIDSDNGLSPGRHQTISLTNAGILVVENKCHPNNYHIQGWHMLQYRQFNGRGGAFILTYLLLHQY